MPSGKLAGVDEHPTMFSTVVIGCDSFNNAGAPALFKALAYVTVGHWEFFQDVSAQRLIQSGSSPSTTYSWIAGTAQPRRLYFAGSRARPGPSGTCVHSQAERPF